MLTVPYYCQIWVDQHADWSIYDIHAYANHRKFGFYICWECGCVQLDLFSLEPLNVSCWSSWVLKLQVWKTDEWHSLGPVCVLGEPKLASLLCCSLNSHRMSREHRTGSFPSCHSTDYPSSSPLVWRLMKGLPPVLDSSQGSFVWPSSIIATFRSAKIRAVALRERPQQGELTFSRLI